MAHHTTAANTTIKRTDAYLEDHSTVDCNASKMGSQMKVDGNAEQAAFPLHAMSPMKAFPTPKPMSRNASTEVDTLAATDYRKVAGGVVPGYSGHVPGARDKYAASASGGVSSKVGQMYAPGPQVGHKKADWKDDTSFDEYRDRVGGVIAGYTGFRPGARDVHHTSAFGGNAATPVRDGKQLGMGNRNKAYAEIRDADKNPEVPQASYRESVKGVVPGYTGFIPGTKQKTGQSHFGGGPLGDPRGAQTMRGGYGGGTSDSRRQFAQAGHDGAPPSTAR